MCGHAALVDSLVNRILTDAEVLTDIFHGQPAVFLVVHYPLLGFGGFRLAFRPRKGRTTSMRHDPPHQGMLRICEYYDRNQPLTPDLCRFIRASATTTSQMRCVVRGLDRA